MWEASHCVWWQPPVFRLILLHSFVKCEITAVTSGVDSLPLASNQNGQTSETLYYEGAFFIAWLRRLLCTWKLLHPVTHFGPRKQILLSFLQVFFYHLCPGILVILPSPPVIMQHKNSQSVPESLRNNWTELVSSEMLSLKCMVCH